MLFALPLALLAETIALPATPEPQFLDCESSVCTNIMLRKEGVKKISIVMECDCTGHNALRLRFGEDENIFH